jgi:tRNA pseudouridine32 synthase/23S rRNA pseudouridine746 synthase
VAKLGGTEDRTEWMIRNRLEEGEPWYRRRIAEENGDHEPNAITRIVLMKSQDGLGLFRLLPETGKKHQLRVHMASIGCPIVGDLVYPNIQNATGSGPPLQLLAHRLSFGDPLSGEPRVLHPLKPLRWPAK